MPVTRVTISHARKQAIMENYCVRGQNAPKYRRVLTTEFVLE